MGSTFTIIVFLLSIAYLMVMIAKVKVHPFFAMITASIGVGLLMKLELTSIVSSITGGFGGILGSLGIVFGLGALLGEMLSESGATEVLADSVLKIAGKKHSSLAMNIIGFIISIPVYMGTAYIILDPMDRSLAYKTKKNVVVYATALSIGLLCTHCLVIPTPGPLAVASTLGLNVGWFILYALIVAIPASLVGGWLWGEVLGKKYPYELPWGFDEANADAVAVESGEDKPSAFLSIAMIFLPIVIIMIGTMMGIVGGESTIGTIGNALTASSGTLSLLISVLIAMVCLRKYLKTPFGKMIPKVFNEQGNILFILGAGGSFGAIVTATGIGDVLVATLQGMNISVVVLAFLLCILLRAALGSSTVALLTTATILGPVAAQMGTNMILLGLSICCGAIGLSLPTDGGFWEVKELDNFDYKKTTLIMTVGTTIAAVVGFAVVMVLSVTSGALPGLH